MQHSTVALAAAAAVAVLAWAALRHKPPKQHKHVQGPRVLVGTDVEDEDEDGSERGLFARMGSVVVFGDSLTQRGFEAGGWVSGLANLFIRRADVINRGFGGYNSRFGRLLMEELFPLPAAGGRRHLLVVVFFGANDAVVEGQPSHVPLSEYVDNLTAIVTHLKKVSHHVVLITPPPVGEQGRLAFQREKYGANASGVLERNTERTGTYADACKQVAAQTATTVVDLWTLMQQQAHWENTLLVDGLHFTEAGNRFVFEELVAVLPRDLRPNWLPTNFPLWADMAPALGAGEEERMLRKHIANNPIRQ